MLFSRLLIIASMIICSTEISASHTSTEKPHNTALYKAIQSALNANLQHSKIKLQFNRNNSVINPIFKLIESHTCSKNEKDDTSSKSDRNTPTNQKFNDFILQIWTP